jgi:ABC-type glycerol-3-phosphate transport system substrate-binding protein
MTHRRNLAAAVAAVSVLAGATAAFAADTTPTPTQVTVTPVTTLHAGDKAPGDAPGVKAIRRGKTIPAGYKLPGQKVDITRGSKQPARSCASSAPATSVCAAS